MSGINNTFIGRGDLINEYKVEFHKENAVVVAKLFHRKVEVNQCPLEGLAITSWWAYITLPAFARLKVDQMRIGHMKQIDPSSVIVQHYGKDKRVQFYTGNESDEENLVETPMPLTVFSKTSSPRPLSMTVLCRDKNVKGSTLIELTHDRVLNLYYALIKEHEIPKTSSAFIQNSLDWFMTLGQWKYLIPTPEIQSSEKLNKVRIFAENQEFIINNDRIYLPKGFNICGQQGVLWRAWDSIDLSYARIVDVLECIKKAAQVNDSEIAKWQLNALSRAKEIKLQSSFLCFMDYLNALMFGIEASGLNAALATGLMTLDLIAEGKLTYKLAFNANRDGGIYPYACIGANKGTYSRREEILYNNRRMCELTCPWSMKYLRINPALSPVALKEAIIIKEWLKHHQILTPESVYNKQISKIQYAINDLLYYYFFPEKERNYQVLKFKNKEAAHR